MNSAITKNMMMVCAPHSNSGKTLFSLWLLAIAKKRGFKTQAIKLGPDYIDASLLSIASSNPVINIDPWAMKIKTQAILLNHAYSNSDFVIIESMMGLFDGTFDGKSSPDIFAKQWKIPWILICSASGHGTSLAPMIMGIINSASSKCIGLIINNLSTMNHMSLIHNAIKRFMKKQIILMSFMKSDKWLWPSRYLGLHQGSNTEINNLLKNVSSVSPIQGSLDNVIKLINRTSKPAFSIRSHNDSNYLLPAMGSTIAIAQDEAFSFIYNAQLSVWRNQGIKILTFSPLKNQPCPSCSAVFLPGGYPERYLNKICNASTTKESIINLSNNNITIYGECGGASVLGDTIIDKEGKTYDGWGLLDFVVSYNKPKLELGYRTVELISSCWLGKAGRKYRGHEFHYGVVTTKNNFDCKPLWKSYSITDNIYKYEGRQKGSVMGTFIHLIDRC